MSESRSAWARSCSTCPAAITAIIAWLANTRRACRRDGEGSSRSAGSSAQMRPTTSPGLVVERHDEPVVVPGMRAAPVHGRGEGAALGRARDRGGLRDQEAALDLEGGVQQRTDLVHRDAPLRRRGQTPSQPATARGVSSPVSGSTSSIMTFWKSSAPETPSQTSCSTSSIERRSDRREETCSSCSSAMRWRAASTASWAPCRARAVERHHGHEQVELVVGRPQAGDRLADGDDAEQVAVGVPAGHEELVAGDPGVVARGRRLGRARSARRARDQTSRPIPCGMK